MTTTEKTPRVGTKARPMYFKPCKGFPRAQIVKWQDALRTAGLPEWLQARAIGRRQMAQIAHLKTDNPRVYEIIAEAHRHSTVEFILRLPTEGGALAYIEQLVREDPDLYGPLKATT